MNGGVRDEADPARPMLRFKRSHMDHFICNVCCARNKAPRQPFEREAPSCERCGSSVRVRSLLHAVGSPQNLAALAVTVVFQVALLINQLGQLHEFRQAIHARREARRAARGAASAPVAEQTREGPAK